MMFVNDIIVTIDIAVVIVVIAIAMMTMIDVNIFFRSATIHLCTGALQYFLP